MVCESREDAANISVVFGHSDPIDVTSDAQWFYYCALAYQFIGQKM